MKYKLTLLGSFTLLIIFVIINISFVGAKHVIVTDDNHYLTKENVLLKEDNKKDHMVIDSLKLELNNKNSLIEELSSKNECNPCK